MSKETDKNRSKNQKEKKGIGIWPIIILTLSFMAIGIVLFFGITSVGADALKTGYEAALDNEKSKTYQEWYDKYYQKAEEKNHVSNDISISIGQVKEISSLEVLQVRDTEYIISGDQDEAGLMAWLEVPGTSNYVVNLQAAEFVVDDIHEHVLVRVPTPELSPVKIDHKNVQKLFFNDNSLIKNEGFKDGEELAASQEKQAYSLIQKEFLSNQYYYEKAKDAAKTNIECLIKQLNPRAEDLKVSVEFY